MVTGDTDQFHWGAGTFASRGAVVAGNAINEAAASVRAQDPQAGRARSSRSAEDDLELADGEVRVKGVPDRRIPLGELALKANPMRGAVKPGTEPGLEATNYFGPERGATASGVHAMIVEVDPETMKVEIQRYVVVHDCGEVINPLILDGQIHGGVAQGIGNAFYEQLVFDEDGQLLNASFMDYLLPTALDVPRIEIDHHVTPSPLNPLGIKGAGEAGAIPVGPLFCPGGRGRARHPGPRDARDPAVAEPAVGAGGEREGRGLIRGREGDGFESRTVYHAFRNSLFGSCLQLDTAPSGRPASSAAIARRGATRQ